MTDRANTAPIGALLDGKFKVLQEIGRGGMAVVFAAENVDIGKRVAVKILAAELASSRTVTERFMREARAAASLNSPYICEVYDVGTFQDRPFIVMELLKGESLYDKLARERLLSVSETLAITTQAARGLKRAHENRIVHRDLKPENVFLARNDEDVVQVKLVDFGLAKFYEPHLDSSNARLTKEGALFGTPAYMSPEQARGKGNVDQRSDLWALACIVYEMLTGRTVWDIDQGVAMILAQIASSPAPSARRFRPDLPAEFDTWLSKALARNVDQRIQTTDEFVSGLERALSAYAPSVTARTTPSDLAISADGQGSATPAPETGSTGYTSTPSFPAPAESDAVLPFGAITSPLPFTPEQSVAVAGSPPSRNRTRTWKGLVAALVLGGVGALALLQGGRAGSFAQRLYGILGGSSLRLGSPIENVGFAGQIGEAQVKLSNGDTEAALDEFRSAFETSQSKAARSFLAHVSVAVESATGACRLQAIGHPRAFDSSGDTSKPTGLLTSNGMLVAWADGPADDRTRTRVTSLDGPLRRIQEISEVSPETRAAREPELFAMKSGLGLLYWDFAGERAGVYVRALDESGRIAGAAQLLSSQEAGHPYYPALTVDGQGAYWVVWTEPSSARVFDLVVRKLDANLKPVSEAVAVTGYASPRTGKTQVNRPSIAVINGTLNITYSLRRGNTQQLLLLRVPADTALRGPGVVAATNETAANDEEGDRFLGSVITLSATGNNDYPIIRCGTSTCYVAWDEAKAGAHVAQLAADGAITWHRRLVADASRPSIALSSRGDAALLSWYENQRVQVAPLTASGPATASVVGRVSAALQQPPPGVIPAGRAGEWFVLWRGYEAAVQEPFVARVNCE